MINFFLTSLTLTSQSDELRKTQFHHRNSFFGGGRGDCGGRVALSRQHFRSTKKWK